MSVTDSERAFYESILGDLDDKAIDDLRYAFYLAYLDGALALGVETIVAGENITVDATDPAHPIISATGEVEAEVSWGSITGDIGDQADLVAALAAAGVVDAVVGGTLITIDSTDPAAPIINFTPTGTPNGSKFLRDDGSWQVTPDTNTTYSIIGESEFNTGSATDARTVSAVSLNRDIAAKVSALAGAVGEPVFEAATVTEAREAQGMYVLEAEDDVPLGAPADSIFFRKIEA